MNVLGQTQTIYHSRFSLFPLLTAEFLWRWRVAFPGEGEKVGYITVGFAAFVTGCQARGGGFLRLRDSACTIVYTSTHLPLIDPRPTEACQETRTLELTAQ